MDDIIDYNSGSGKGKIVINADPNAGVIQEFGNCIRKFSNDIKEYKITKEQEETKRAEIKAHMKIMIAEIDAKKEIVLKYMDNQHERNMEQIRLYGDLVMRSLDGYIESIKDARECAKKENDFTQVIVLLDKLNEFTELRARFMLEQMDKIECINAKPLPQLPR